MKLKTYTHLLKNLGQSIKVRFEYSVQEEQNQTISVNSGEQFYAGNVQFVPPIRDRFSKWFVSIEEYPYNLFPPFINAGAYVISIKTLRTLYIASQFVKPFRFDDVYLGILAKKCGINLHHCERFWRSRKDKNIDDLNYTIASHDFQDTKELENVWLRQKEHGHA